MTSSQDDFLAAKKTLMQLFFLFSGDYQRLRAETEESIRELLGTLQQSRAALMEVITTYTKQKISPKVARDD